MNELAKAEQQTAAVALPEDMQSRIDRLAFDEKLNSYFMARAEDMAKSRFMPPIFRGDKFGCFFIQQLAFQWAMNPVLLAPGLYKVSEEAPISLEGKIVKTIVDRWAPVKDGFIADEYFGDWDKILGKFETRTSKSKTDKYGNPATYKVPAWKPEDEQGLGITLRAETKTGHKIEYTLRMTQCLTRNSTLWAEDPQLQLYYRAIARFARKYFPGLLGGMMVKEELQDGEVIDITPAPAAAPESTGKSKAEKLAEKLGAKKTEKPAEKAPQSDENAKPHEGEGVKDKTSQNPVSVEKMIADAAIAEGVQMTLAEFCEMLSKTPGQYTPDALEGSRPDWLTKDPAKWVRLAIAEKNKRGKKTADTLL